MHNKYYIKIKNNSQIVVRPPEIVRARRRHSRSENGERVAVLPENC
jgi:hypothetical protein